MRYKITFLKSEDRNASIPLHHQHVLGAWLKPMMAEFGAEQNWITFSTLKGTTRIINGNIRFLSSKVSMSISCNDPSVADALCAKVMACEEIVLDTIRLKPHKADIVPTPEFNTKMKFVCISPMILETHTKSPEELKAVNPSVQEFSDEIFHTIMDRLEQAGYSTKQLDAYQVFGITADKEYLEKAQLSNRKIARLYPDLDGNEHLGYLFPFTMHAHPDVQRFAWECGIGQLNNQGYGMIDVAVVS